MHLTLKKEATKPAAANFLQQQARFDKFIEIFNHQRPHEALDVNIPQKSTNLRRVAIPGCRTSTTPSTTKPSWSLAAAASVWEARKSISARSLPDRRSASKKGEGEGKEKGRGGEFTTISGWSVLWSMIWVTSIWRPKFWNRFKFPSAQKCYPCSRYILLPMCPGRTFGIWWRR